MSADQRKIEDIVIFGPVELKIKIIESTPQKKMTDEVAL